MARTPTSEIFKDRRVQVGAALGVLLIGAGAWFALNSGGGGEETGAGTTPSAPAAAGNPAAPGGAPVPGAPGAPVPGGVPGAPGAAKTTAAAPKAGASPAVVASDSWSAAPASFGVGGAGAGAAEGAGAAGMPGAASVAGAPGAAGAAGGGAGGGKLPAPIKQGVEAASFRGDPFVTTRKFVVDKPFAYTFLAPFRLASRPTPPPVNIAEKNGLTQNDLRPLPPVARRVAGVLYDGSTSAILETGQPGPDADVRVVQPGARVPSGVPGIGDLIVSVITPTQVTLRSDDGRIVTVPLSNLPPAIADQLRAQASQAIQGAGGVPGAPGGPFPPGVGPGGGPFAPGAGPRGFGPGGAPGEALP